MVYCSCSLVSKIYQIYHRSSLFPSQYTSGGSRGWAGGPVPPSYFLTKMRPEGPKKIFLETDPPDPPPPPSSEGLDLPLQHTIYQPHFQVNIHQIDCTSSKFGQWSGWL